MHSRREEEEDEGEEEEEELELYYRENRDILDLIREFEEDSRESGGGGGGMALGFKKGESMAVIDEIARGELPREDGYVDTFEEKRNAENRPFSKKYLIEEVRRLNLMEKNSDFRWTQYMAGAMGREVHEIYREDDLQRVLLETERRREIMKADIKRTIGPMKEKQDQLLLLVGEKRNLVKEQELFNLSEEITIIQKGKELLEGDKRGLMGFTMIFEVIEFINNLYQDDIKNGGGDDNETKESYKEYIKENIVKDYKDDSSANEIQMMRNSFANDNTKILRKAVDVIKMRNYFFDAHSKDSIVHQYTIGLRLLPNTIEMSNGETAVLIRELSPDMELENFFLRLEGYEIVYSPYVERLYDEPTVRVMLIKGLKEYKNTWKYANYPELMLRYLDTEEFENDELNLLVDQPPPVRKILQRVMSNDIVFEEDENGMKDRRIFKIILRAHFLWKYFHESSALTLAYHWMNSANDKIAEGITFFSNLYDRLQESYKTLLAVYINRFVLESMRDIKGINQMPIFDMLLFPGEDDVEEEFDSERWNRLLGSGDDIYKYIQDADFRSYALTGNCSFITTTNDNEDYNPLKMFGKKHASIIFQYPILKLPLFFETAVSYLTKYKAFKAVKLEETERAITQTKDVMAKIASERSPMNGSTVLAGNPPYNQTRQFVTKTINSGIIRLKPEITTFMSTAHTKVQKYCPSLMGLKLEEYQSDQANECGLESDFACYVAALIAKNGNVFPRTYKSKHHVTTTIVNETEAFHALRYYRYGEVRGKTTIWRAAFPMTMAVEDRKILVAKRRLLF